MRMRDQRMKNYYRFFSPAARVFEYYLFAFGIKIEKIHTHTHSHPIHKLTFNQKEKQHVKETN